MRDIVFGTGVDRIAPGQDRYTIRPEPQVSGYTVAVSGATNALLWSVPNPRDAFTTPRFLDVNRDATPDVIMGGREGTLTAFSGKDGAVLWRTSGDRIAETDVPWNFFTPAIIDDVNADGLQDLVVLYGGDDTRPPNTPRAPGWLAVISSADGAVIARAQTPDGAESYNSAVAYRRADGSSWLVFGTGGETAPGAAWRVPIASLLDGTFPQHVERLVEPGSKGVIAPAVIIELTGDDEPDIVISTFDGRLIAVDGRSAQPLWEQRSEGEEAYHPPAVVRRDRRGTIAFFVSRGRGVFPGYEASLHRLIDAENGRVLVEYSNADAPAGAPLAVDLTGDGVDEPVFFSMRFPRGQSSRIHILHLATSKLITYDLPTILTTPVIADVRGSGALELIGVAWQVHQDSTARADAAAPPWQNLRWQLIRLDLTAPPPPFMSWAAYMGTSNDGRFRAPPRE